MVALNHLAERALGDEAPSRTAQVNLKTTQVVQHLLWHKAMTEYDEEDKIGRYVEIVTHNEEGEHFSIKDDFHRDIAIAFELVIGEHMDPWNLDLSKFAEMYLKTARERGVDLVTAGRIILMAWTVLKLQSDDIAEKATFIEEEDHMDWEDFPDMAWSDDEWDFTERINALPEAPIDEKIRHKGDRRVTLMELLGAFEEVHEEAEQRVTLAAQQSKARNSLKRKMRGRVGNMMHKEDLEAEIAETWQRILEHPTQPIPFSHLYEKDALDLVQTFTAVLFLAKSQKISLSQEDFPRGEIWLTPNLPEMAAALPEQEVTA
ncbi:MAG: segregation/condensation protein A [Thermoplasmatota archaeon]